MENKLEEVEEEPVSSTPIGLYEINRFSRVGYTFHIMGRVHPA
jgi:hypothetical protein